MLKDTPKTRCLHIYGQSAPHDAINIVGTKEALEHLKNIIDITINANTCANGFQNNDGEGYILRVTKCSDLTMVQLQTPYSSDDFRDRNVQHLRVDQI